MRWLHRLKQVLSAVARVIATLVKAAVQTLRQRRGRAARQAGKTHDAAHPDDPDADTGGARKREPHASDQRGEIVVNGTAIPMPNPSIWPAVVGLGTALSLFGVATSLGISLAGVIVLAVGLGGWIGELHHE